MRMCFPSMAPMQLLKFHFSVKSWAIFSPFLLGIRHRKTIFLCLLLYTQEDVSEEDRIVTVLDDDEGEATTVLGTSTKQPTKQEKRPTKHQQIESAENELISKAISCMDIAVGGHTNDSYELYLDMLF